MTITRKKLSCSSTFIGGIWTSATALALLVVSPAVAQTETSVTAGAEESIAGIKTYEVAAEIETAPESALWFCQVVGRPCIAGSINVTEQDGQITAIVRHSKSGAELTVTLLQDRTFFVMRGSIQVAAVIPAPPGSGIPDMVTGVDALSTDPAWQLFWTAMADSNLRAALDTAGGTAAPACRENCPNTVDPSPNGETLEMQAYRCHVAADRAYCEALCGCATAAVPDLCRSIAAAERLSDWVACQAITWQVPRS